MTSLLKNYIKRVYIEQPISFWHDNGFELSNDAEPVYFWYL